MSNKNGDLYRDDLAAYALGALDEAEASALESHLKTCPECRAELATFTEVSEGLLLATPPQAPPASLKRKIAAQLPAPKQSFFGEFFEQLQNISFFQVATAAAFVFLIGMSLYSTAQVRQLQQQQALLTHYMEVEQSAVAMLAYPNTETILVSEGIAGSLLINRERNTAVLFTWHMPSAPSGKQYQIWLITADGERVSGGVFDALPGEEYTSAEIELEQDLDLASFNRLGVTVEPMGGSPHPTGENVLRVDF